MKSQQQPLKNYYSNMPNMSYDSKQSAQIKRVRSSENIPLMPSNKQFDNVAKSKPQTVNKESTQKSVFIEPGKQINESFEEVLSTTTITEKGVTTYFIAKALKGPLLKYASQ